MAATDAGAIPSAVRRYFAAVDRHGAARAAADTRAALAARRGNRAAIDRHGTAGAVLAEADARAIGATGRRYGSTVYRDHAAGAIRAAAEPRRIIAARCDNFAAVDRYRAASAVVTAADAGGMIATGRRHLAAVDRNRTAGGIVAAADTGAAEMLTIADSVQPARSEGLSVDRQRGAVRDDNARARRAAGYRQRCSVVQDKADVTLDGERIREHDIVRDGVPSRRDRRNERRDNSAFHKLVLTVDVTIACLHLLFAGDDLAARLAVQLNHAGDRNHFSEVFHRVARHRRQAATDPKRPVA